MIPSRPDIGLKDLHNGLPDRQGKDCRRELLLACRGKYRINSYSLNARNLSMPLLANAIPKSGTHLLCRALDLLGLGRDGTVRFAPNAGELTPEQISYDGNGRYDYADEFVPLAAATVRLVSRERFAAMVERFAANSRLEYCDAHLAWSQVAQDFLAKSGVKVAVILRDPRAVAWSHVNWIVGKTGPHPHKALFAQLPLRDCLRHEFFGLPPDVQKAWPPLIPMLSRYRNMANWADYPYLFVTTFEDLVGEQGGGSAERQARAIRALADFAGVTAFDLGKTQDLLWGRSPTFRVGRTDSWRAHVEEFPDGLGEQVAEMDHIVRLLLKRFGSISTAPAA
jgi:hypothetical protein